jgi:predicted nucleic acid-binding protein
VEIFFDTTVLVAASEQSHPHYAPARRALRRVAAGEDRGFISVYSIAEIYASLTLLPVQPRIHPLEAVRIVTENILPHFEVLTIGKEEYLEALNTAGSGGWTGAKIHDALLLRCAARCKLDRIYTLNVEDFRQLAPARLQGLVCAP